MSDQPRSRRVSTSLRFFAALVAAVALVLAAGGAAYAQAAAPAQGRDQLAQNQGRWVPWRLQIQLRVEQRVARGEARLLEQAKAFLPRAEERLAQAKAAGKDVAKIEKALNAFAAAVEEAGDQLEEIKSILTKHAGFDDAGKVTDVQLARKTVQEAGKLEREFGKTLRPAWQNLREALREYREANQTRI